jgi:hypothetical protein
LASAIIHLTIAPIAAGAALEQAGESSGRGREFFR